MTTHGRYAHNDKMLSRHCGASRLHQLRPDRTRITLVAIRGYPVRCHIGDCLADWKNAFAAAISRCSPKSRRSIAGSEGRQARAATFSLMRVLDTVVTDGGHTIAAKFHNRLPLRTVCASFAFAIRPRKAHVFSSRLSSFRKRQSVCSAMSLCGLDLISPASCMRSA
jgi:hypothetical protein